MFSAVYEDVPPSVIVTLTSSDALFLTSSSFFFVSSKALLSVATFNESSLSAD